MLTCAPTRHSLLKFLGGSVCLRNREIKRGQFLATLFSRRVKQRPKTASALRRLSGPSLFKLFGKREGRKAPRLVESVNSGVCNMLLASCNVPFKIRKWQRRGRRKSGSGVNNRHQWSTNEENESQEGINSFPFC